MKLSNLFLCFIVAQCFGANPSYQSFSTNDFRWTNGSFITINTNRIAIVGVNGTFTQAGTNVSIMTNSATLLTLSADVSKQFVTNVATALGGVGAQHGSVNLTNWSQLTTNVFYPSNNPAGFAPSNALGSAAYSNGAAFVLKAGDTMSGALTITAGGLTNKDGRLVMSNTVNLSYFEIGTNGSMKSTNGTGANQYWTMTNGATYQSGVASVAGFTNRGLTASRMVLTDINKGGASATASGAVPIDADGTATTFAQVDALSGALSASHLPALTGVITTSSGSAATSLGSFSSSALAGAVTDETGAGAGTPLAVFNQSPVIVTPTIASFVNSAHTHQNAAGGGTLDAAAIAAGTMATARLGSGSATANTVLHGDQTYGAVSLSADVSGSLPIASVSNPSFIITNNTSVAAVMSNAWTFYQSPNLAGKTNYVALNGDLIQSTNAQTGKSFLYTNGTVTVPNITGPSLTLGTTSGNLQLSSSGSILAFQELRPSGNDTIDLGLAGNLWRGIYGSNIFIANIIVTNVVVSTNGFQSWRSNQVALYSVPLGSSPYSWVNTNNCNVFALLAGGTVSAITLNGTTLPAAFLTGSDTLPMQTNETLTITYTVAPTVLIKPF